MNFFKQLPQLWGRAVIRYRWAIIVLIPLLVILSSGPAANIYFAHSVDMWFAPQDPTRRGYERFKKIFGDTEFILVSFEAPEKDANVFTPDTMEAIVRTHEYLQRHELVKSVVSLQNYRVIKTADDAIDIQKLIEKPELIREEVEDPAHQAKLATTMAGERLAVDLLITKDLRHTIVLAEVMHLQEIGVNDEVRLVNDLKAFLNNEHYERRGITAHVFGRPYITHQITTSNIKDQSIFYPLMALMTATVLFICFRRFSAVALTWLVIVLAIMASFNFQGAMRWPTNVASASLPMLIVVVSMGLVLHLLWEFYRQRSLGASPKEAAELAVGILWLPAFSSTASAVLGFFGVTLSRLEPIRQYGFVAVVGVTATFLCALALLPALLSFVKTVPKHLQRDQKREDHKHLAVERMLMKLGKFVVARAGVVAGVFLVILAAGAVLTTQLSIDSNFIKMFKQDSEFRREFSYFDRVFKGGQSIEFIIDSGVPDGALDPQLLRRAQELETYLGGLERAGKPDSVLGYLCQLHQSMHNDDPKEFRLPDSKELAAQLLLMYENNNDDRRLARYLTDDHRYLRISIRTQNMSAIQTREFIGGIEDSLKDRFADLTVDVTGDLVLFNTMDYYISQGMVKSFLFDIGTVALGAWLILMSIRKTGVLMMVSLMPILFTGGFMKLTGISADMTTTIIGAVTFGISVDDVLHFMTRFQRARGDGLSIEDAIYRSYVQAGGGMLLSSVVVGMGFSVFLFSSLVSAIYFGLLSLIIIVVGIIGDLMFLPAVLCLLERRKARSAQPAPIMRQVVEEEMAVEVSR